MNDFIDFKVGDLKTVIEDVNEDFDLIFQDVGGKTLYNTMFNDYLRLLKTGRRLLVEDVPLPVFI
ncbi:hypothetical protein [Wukongibacter sp. M2B1]|uniref:hypothetical protein n=1 Tax=Wukongibacter sp. M2B1 TaxID=3088895 RepID=UPI003D7A0BC2